MKLISARREFISATAELDSGGLTLRYQVMAVGEKITFDQELRIDILSDGSAQAYMQMEGMPVQPNQEAAAQRMADYLEMLSKALRATNPGRRKVKTRNIPIQLHGSTQLIHKPRTR
jgi:hypothetical protein